jgi:hypothetical protein
MELAWPALPGEEGQGEGLKNCSISFRRAPIEQGRGDGPLERYRSVTVKLLATVCMRRGVGQPVLFGRTMSLKVPTLRIQIT